MDRALQFHPRGGGKTTQQALTMLTWNVGGAGAKKVLDILLTLSRGGGPHANLATVNVVTLQEVICEPGIHIESSENWTLVMGKMDTEWRGEGVAYDNLKYCHTQAESLEGGLSVVLWGGKTAQRAPPDAPTTTDTPTPPPQTTNTPTTTPPCSNEGHTKPTMVGVLSAHLPHHATIPQTERILTGWGACTALAEMRVILGGDLNETFRELEMGAAASTGRGETLLRWMEEHELRLPDQAMDEPSYHPYNTAMRARRLDYIATRRLPAGEGHVMEGTRDIIQSDHDAVMLETNFAVRNKPKLTATWGARVLKDLDQVEEALREQRRGDPHHIIAEVAKAITVPAPQGGEPWQESDKLKHLRHRAKHAGEAERRGLWKQVWNTHKRERKAWLRRKVQAAANMNWGELRALGKQRQNKQWEHHLLGRPGWQDELREHFEGTFAKVSRERVQKAFGELRRALEHRCKRTPWKPFEEEELVAAMATWGRRKATGVDGTSLEALRAMQQDRVWGERLLYLYNDVLYTGKLHGKMGEGVTILLPKVTLPTEWGQTRPITLSSSTLKWLSQLLLGRCSHHFEPLTKFQWAWRGKQAEELIMVLRKVVRTGVEWKLPTWIAKLDVRKAFDSVHQQNMGAMVAHWVGDRGGQPWEARTWMALLEAETVQVAIGGEIVIVLQTTGVRQGAPDSPVLFAALMGRALQQARLPATRQGAGPPCPHNEGAFMDDTYVWDHDAENFQKRLTSVEETLKKDGLHIHPKKTAIITNAEQPGRFRIGGEWVDPQPEEGSFHILGSPVAFKNQVTLLIAEMRTRARKAFHAHAQELTARTPLPPRLKLMLVYLRPAALWGCSAWPPHETLLKAANSCQLHYVRKIVGLGKRAGETWVDWNQRGLRDARAKVHHHQVQRWSTHALRRIWGLWGHVARQHESCTKEILLWRGQKWWKAEQANPRGLRHPSRFNPHTDIERAVAAVGGQDWDIRAQDRLWWQAQTEEFVTRHDPPWSSGRQKALGNLAPNKTTRNTGGGRKRGNLAITDDVAHRNG